MMNKPLVAWRSTRVVLACTMVVMTLTGCTSKPSPGATAAQPADGERQAQGDFSTPKAAVETFIAAAAARDAELLSRSVADNAAGEFAKLREKTAGQDDVDGLAKLLKGGQITDVKVDEPNGTAVVAVKLNSRDERIHLTKEAGGWKIADF